MMANHYHNRLSSANYCSAIKDIFKQDVYMELKGPTGVITDLTISETPDMFSLDTSIDSDETIEMVGESDYEFIVRAAKRFNYEFFCLSGKVLFRQAKADLSTLIELNNFSKVFALSVSYDVTGLVNKVTVRGLDAGDAKVIKSSTSNKNKISSKSMAKSLFSGSEYVYTDPTVRAISDAQHRAYYLSENMAYKYGTLDMEIMGLPEIIPGRFIDLVDFGKTVSNSFYVTTVQHKLPVTGRYTTRIIGKAQQLQQDLPGL
jgi:phage protein D